MIDRRRLPFVIVVAVWLITTALWLTAGVNRPDGAGYFIYLPSTYFDRDLLFFDEWAAAGLIRNGEILFKDVTVTGYLGNHWTVGCALGWYPAYVVGDAVAAASGAPRDGFSPPYVAAVVAMSALAGLFVLLAGMRVVGGWAGAWGAVAVWLGTPLAWYALRHATMSHAISAAAAAAVVLLSLRLRDGVTMRVSFAIGLAVGFACAVRPQNAPIALIPLIIAAGAWRKAHVMAGGALLAALPQFIVSQTLWAAPLAFINIGGEAYPWQMLRRFRPLEILLSFYNGLIPWSPLVVIALAGLALLWRKDRRLAAAGLFLFSADWLVLASMERFFWGGSSFGQRRFDNCAIFFIIGVAEVLRRFPRLGGLVTALATGWTTLLFIAAGRLNLNAYHPPGELLDAISGALADPRWRTLLGYTPETMRGVVLLTTLVIALMVVCVARFAGTKTATVYLLLMTALFAWSATHPKRDAFSEAMVQRGVVRGGLTDVRGLLLREAEYMDRTGRPGEARRAREDAAALRP